ncbi:MAG: carbon storage regulator [Planctomycetota bacterium]|nr:carbon storage regulator [Planctomycetota bacterium]
MLVLTRKIGEKIHVGNDVVITVIRIQNDKVRVGIQAPADVTVHRDEVYDRIHQRRTSGTGAAESSPS